MVLVGHCTWNDWPAAGSAATQKSTNKINVVPNFLLAMYPPSSFILLPSSPQAAEKSRLHLHPVDQVHAASRFQYLDCTATGTQTSHSNEGDSISFG